MKSVILTNSEPERLDTALARVLGVSRAKAQKAIKDGRVRVSGENITPHSLVDSTSHVEIVDDEVLDTPVGHNNLPDLDVLYEDADVLVVNKPAGLLVHPTATSTEPTLRDAVVARNPEIATVGDDPRRAGIVHRLDKDASGVVIVAKTTAAFAHLKHTFAARVTRKHYTVLVMGKVRDDVGTITFPIARSRSKARMAARSRLVHSVSATAPFDAA